VTTDKLSSSEHNKQGTTVSSQHTSSIKHRNRRYLPINNAAQCIIYRAMISD